VRRARISVTVRHPEWDGPARLRGHQWRLAEWADLSPERVPHVVYIPGLMADYTPDAPLVLLRAARERGQPVQATVLDLPEYGTTRLPPGWAARLARAASLIDAATLLRLVLDRVAPHGYMVVGGSVGANLATILAAIAPEQVRAVQLCMPAGLYSQPVWTHLVPTVLVTAALGFRTPAHRALAFRPESVGASLALLGSFGKLPSVLQTIRLLARANAVPFAARVRCPVAVALGRRDIVFDRLPAMHAQGELAALFPSAPSVAVYLLDEADHNGFATHSVELAAITLAMLEQLETRG
jgi:pimeloyl-ACP methyl ester carboxylesterase